MRLLFRRPRVLQLPVLAALTVFFPLADIAVMVPASGLNESGCVCSPSNCTKTRVRMAAVWIHHSALQYVPRRLLDRLPRLLCKWISHMGNARARLAFILDKHVVGWCSAS
ncbi:hypothetical protein OH77DRAFT_1426723 [Trametes cingulata]|nr:hypothetical protein OH77DRAFT_1426723 [Trametes cingulata]